MANIPLLVHANYRGPQLPTDEILHWLYIGAPYRLEIMPDDQGGWSVTPTHTFKPNGGAVAMKVPPLQYADQQQLLCYWEGLTDMEGQRVDLAAME